MGDTKRGVGVRKRRVRGNIIGLQKAQKTRIKDERRARKDGGSGVTSKEKG